MAAEVHEQRLHRYSLTRGGGAWPCHLALLAGMVALLVFLFWSDAIAIVDIWSRMGAFHHCFLIPPILVWLVWQKRDQLAQVAPGYSFLGILWLGCGLLLWLVGAAGYVALLRQAGLVLAGQGLVIALLGVPVARALIFPLGFAFFLIPVGTEIEPVLQEVTARVAVALLHLTGTPAMLEGVFVTTPAGLFRVAEACSGTAFLLAMAAYATLVAAMCFESWRRRAAFITIAMTAALLTNGLRAFAIMMLANLTSIDNPMVQDHLLLGWLLFALVLGALMLASSRWFDRPVDRDGSDIAASPAPSRSNRPPWTVTGVILVALLLPPLWLSATEPRGNAMPSPPVAPMVEGWDVLPGSYRADWQPHFAGATWIGQWRYRQRTGGATIDLAMVLFQRQGEGREIVGFGQGAIAPDSGWALMDDAPAPPQGRGEWLRAVDGRVRYAATFYLVADMVTGNRLMAKLVATGARLLGGPQQATAILLSTERKPGIAQERIISEFVKDAGSIEEMAGLASGIR